MSYWAKQAASGLFDSSGTELLLALLDKTILTQLLPSKTTAVEKGLKGPIFFSFSDVNFSSLTPEEQLRTITYQKTI